MTLRKACTPNPVRSLLYRVADPVVSQRLWRKPERPSPGPVWGEVRLRGAGLLPMPYLRGLDALHFEAVMRLDATAVLAYDHRLGKATRVVGLQVIALGTAHT